MIKLYGTEVDVNHFPDKTQLIKIKDKVDDVGYVFENMCRAIIEWKYESDEELVTLIYLVNHMRDKMEIDDFYLKMLYIPNARMDRTNSAYEVFTLKYFCGIINSLNFTSIEVLDAHSNVSLALLDRVVEINPLKYIQEAINRVRDEELHYEDIVLFFPDNGSMKRYSKIIKNISDISYCHGEKERDWETGELKHEIKIVNDFNIDLRCKTILMVDDIIAYGGTMINSAKALKELKVGNIYAYATHVENSILSSDRTTLVDINDVNKIYTTDSLYNGTHEKIEVIN